MVDWRLLGLALLAIFGTFGGFLCGYMVCKYSTLSKKKDKENKEITHDDDDWHVEVSG